jgi:hypothetical protein
MAALTIDEIKKKKIKLESDILKLVQAYEKETKSYVSYINFERKVSKEAEKGYNVPLPEPSRSGPVENINVEMRFDL